MRRSTSALSYLGISAFLPHYSLHAFAGQHSREVALLANGKDHDRYVVVAAQGHGRGVHHLQVVRKHPVVTYGFETLGVRILLGVVVIDSVDAGAFEQRIALHLRGAQRGSAVSGEVRAADTGSEDHHAVLLEMPLGTAADYRLAHLVHLNRRL